MWAVRVVLTQEIEREYLLRGKIGKELRQLQHILELGDQEVAEMFRLIRFSAWETIVFHEMVCLFLSLSTNQFGLRSPTRTKKKADIVDCCGFSCFSSNKLFT